MNAIRHHPLSGLSVLRAAALINAVFIAAMVRFRLVMRLRSDRNAYLNVIFHYAMLRRYLRKVEGIKFWCVIGDLSPFLIALAAAVKAEDHKLLTWQYGYQDFKHFPVRPDIAVVLNRKGVELARADRADSMVPVLQRNTISPVPVRWPADRRDAVGIVLNAFSRSSLPETVRQIQAHLGCRLVVRPHPRDSSREELKAIPGVAVVSGESLEDFVSRVDWIICGNTTTTLKLLGQGVPVCQFFGFDHFFDDHFHYMEMALIPGYTEVHDLDETKLRSFYAQNTDVNKLNELFGRAGMVKSSPLREISRVLDSVLGVASSRAIKAD
mgnify:CR=1 FL=1